MTSLSPTFFIGNIRIGTVEGASCVNLGNNLPSNFNNYKKQNQGFGSIHGNGNDIQGIRSLLTSSPILELLSNSNLDDVPDWAREAILSKIGNQE